MNNLPPTNDDVWTLYVIQFARVENQPWVDLVKGTFNSGTVVLPFSFVLAQRGDRNVLIDCGFMQAAGPDAKPWFNIPNWVSPIRMLAELGVAADKVTDVFVTHAHFDHMGSIAEFPNARIFIQKAELLFWYEAIALPVRYSRLTSIIYPDHLRAALDASIEHRMVLLEGDQDNVLPGINVKMGTGHTPGQQFVSVETARGRLVVSGDCLYSAEQLTGHNHDGIYRPLNNAVGPVLDQLKTLDLINSEIEGDLNRLIIIHDTENWRGLEVAREVDGFRIFKAS